VITGKNIIAVSYDESGKTSSSDKKGREPHDGGS